LSKCLSPGPSKPQSRSPGKTEVFQTAGFELQESV
jgi:hypothetical protein